MRRWQPEVNMHAASDVMSMISYALNADSGR